MPVNTAAPRRRGYMLVEAVIAGALVAVALGAVASQLGSADARGSAAVRLLQATQALQDGLGRAHASGWASVTGGTDNPPGCVDRTITVSTVTSSTCQGCKQVTVRVRYKNALGIIQTIQETVYRAP